MRILIIGNGFDKAHGLPTSYGEVLKKLILFQRKNVCIVGTELDYLVHGELDSNEYNSLNAFCKSFKSFAVAKKLLELSKDSFWLRYFDIHKESIGEKWLDFEEGIRNVIDSLRESMANNPNQSISLEAHNRMLGFSPKLPVLKNNTYAGLFRKLQEDLENVKEALSIYMGTYLDTREVNVLDEIEKIKADRVLSFNYSHTYIKHYHTLAEICYIHGRAYSASNPNSGKVVLGFDNSNTNAHANYYPKEVIPFEKYYQRIVYHTDNDYISWLDQINAEKSNVEVIIFGHSLAPFDGDILKKFITNKYVHTKIYHTDAEDKAEKIKNLAIILGKEDLINLAGGPNPRITWKEYDSRIIEVK